MQTWDRVNNYRRTRPFDISLHIGAEHVQYVLHVFMSLSRDPAEPPAIPASAGTPTRHILFCHPGYEDSNNVLLKLFVPDLESEAGVRGLYAQYALDACGSSQAIGAKDGCRR